MSEQASTESTTTATAAPYGDPVTAQPAEVSNTPQVNDTTGTALETIQQKLDSFLAAVGTGKQQGEPTDDVDAQKEASPRSEEHTSELQSRGHLVCRLLLEKKKKKK